MYGGVAINALFKPKEWRTPLRESREWVLKIEQDVYSLSTGILGARQEDIEFEKVLNQNECDNAI